MRFAISDKVDGSGTWFTSQIDNAYNVGSSRKGSDMIIAGTYPLISHTNNGGAITTDQVRDIYN